MTRRPIAILPALILLALVSVSTDVCAQPWARKMFTELSHDFGNVTKGQRPVHKFEIQNVFQEDIQIAGVDSSCGCTSVSLSKKVLKTWEKGEVICQFNSPAFDGQKSATVTVRFNRPYVGEVQLTVRGNIVRGQGFNVTPRSIDFGQVSDKNLPERSVELTSVGGSNFRVVDVKSTFPHISVRLKEKTRSANSVSYTMTTRLKKSVPNGFNQGDLYVVVQEGQSTREVPIGFSAKVVSGIRLSPEILSLSRVEPGEEIRKKIIIKGEAPFRIVDVTCHSQAFRVRASKEAKKIHMVDVIYTGEQEAGRHECELSFFTDLGGSEPTKLRAMVEIVDPQVSQSADGNGL